MRRSEPVETGSWSALDSGRGAGEPSDMVWIAVAGGGALGAVFRYAVFAAIGSARFPWATLIVNVVGAFGLAVVAGYLDARGSVGGAGTRFLTVGFFGALTTYSTFNLELLSLARDGRWGAAAVYGGGTAVACAVLGLVGLACGRQLG